MLLAGEKGQTLHLQQVLYTPSFHKNIVCVGAFVKKADYEVQISGQSLRMSRKGMTGHLDFQSNKNGMLYYFCGTRMPGKTNTAMTVQTISDAKNKIDINDTHDRFGHIGEAALRAT